MVGSKIAQDILKLFKEKEEISPTYGCKRMSMMQENEQEEEEEEQDNLKQT